MIPTLGVGMGRRGGYDSVSEWLVWREGPRKKRGSDGKSPWQSEWEEGTREGG